MVDIDSKIKFTGSNCDEVTIFLGGFNASETHEWKSNTLEGGWIIQTDGKRDEFYPGDYICKFEDGSFAVGHVCRRHNDI